MPDNHAKQIIDRAKQRDERDKRQAREHAARLERKADEGKRRQARWEGRDER